MTFAAPVCTCPECAVRYGDQAEDADGLELASLRAENAALREQRSALVREQHARGLLVDNGDAENRELRAEASRMRDEVGRLEGEVCRLEDEVADLSAQLDALEAELARINEVRMRHAT